MHDAAWAKANIAAQAIKKGANDPASVAFNESGYTEAGAVFIEFRAKNSFGGLIKQVAVVTPDGKLIVGSSSDSAVAAAWNRHIANRTLYSLPTPSA